MAKNYHADNKSFMMYKEWEELFDALEPEEVSQLVKALFAFACRGEEPQLSGALKIAFITMRNAIERDGIKWEEKCERNTENARKRWNKKITQPCDRIHKNTNCTDKDKEKDKEKDKDKDKDTSAVQPYESESVCDENCFYYDSEQFELFWKAYPKKFAKENAVKQWCVLSPDSSLVREMLSAVEKQKKSPQWQEQEGRFIPYPEKWLRERRWEDNITVNSSVQNDYSFNLDDYRSLVNNFGGDD
ncbi:MAG: hypothetical protein IJA12_08330 [Oscillospiraceae bacterium]|nr:hypothetical protein [Oscillospiraceae bacterium]